MFCFSFFFLTHLELGQDIGGHNTAAVPLCMHRPPHCNRHLNTSPPLPLPPCMHPSSLLLLPYPFSNHLVEYFLLFFFFLTHLELGQDIGSHNTATIPSHVHRPCYNFRHSLFFTYLSLTSPSPIHAASSFFRMISSLRHYDTIPILDLPILSSSCTRMTSSYIMRRQPASLVCP